MIFYQLSLGVPAIVALLSVVFAFFLHKEKTALTLLMISVFLIRLLIIQFDPYLADWDERYHAVVGWNMLNTPFMPTIRPSPVLAYDYTAWCCNYVWLHKQPLFLWQIALSLKTFGISEFAVRLPSAVLGALSVLFTYSIGKKWFNDFKVGYVYLTPPDFACE